MSHPVIREFKEKLQSKPAAQDITQASQDGTPAPKQADILISMSESTTLFRTPAGIGYADYDVNGHRETWPIRSAVFRRWLVHQFYKKQKSAPNNDALQQALATLEAKAHYEADERDVYIRVAELGGKIYLDLCDEAWRAVEIDAAGWRVITKPPVRFRRAPGMLPLPEPSRSGSITLLRPFVNVKSKEDFVLAVSWALAALRGRGPYPVLALAGEHGSAKSTLAAILRSLMDPNTTPLRSLPREDRDMFIAANNGHVLIFDNISTLPGWISDTLCRIATGGGFATRSLYTDQDEVLFDAQRPVILNGIEDVVSRPDLADRSLFLTLATIPERKRRTERDVWAEFEAVQPRILGALLNAVSKGLAMLPKTKLEKLPRMADFALWAVACEAAMWKPGRFVEAYAGNREKAVDEVLEGDVLAVTLRGLMERRGWEEWKGTATALLKDLALQAGEPVAKSKAWPVDAKRLSNRLRRLSPFLRTVGIEITKLPGRAHGRQIVISGKPPVTERKTSSSPSPSSNVNDYDGLVGTIDRTMNGAEQSNVLATVLDKPFESNEKDVRDTQDDVFPSHTGSQAVTTPRMTWHDDDPRWVTGGD
jgi:hypothetical protein